MKKCTTNPCPYKEPYCPTCGFYKETNEELIVYGNGLVECSVCTNVTDEKRIVELVNMKNPTGLSHGWIISKDPKFLSGESNPCPCNQNPKTHKHYLMMC